MHLFTAQVTTVFYHPIKLSQKKRGVREVQYAQTKDSPSISHSIHAVYKPKIIQTKAYYLSKQA